MSAPFLGIGRLHILSFLVLFSATYVSAEQKWKIHEWGTFTSLQNENGDAVGGMSQHRSGHDNDGGKCNKLHDHKRHENLQFRDYEATRLPAGAPAIDRRISVSACTLRNL